MDPSMLECDQDIFLSGCASFLRIIFGEDNWNKWNAIRKQCQTDDLHAFISWLLTTAEIQLNQQEQEYQEQQQESLTATGCDNCNGHRGDSYDNDTVLEGGAGDVNGGEWSCQDVDGGVDAEAESQATAAVPYRDTHRPGSAHPWQQEGGGSGRPTTAATSSTSVVASSLRRDDDMSHYDTTRVKQEEMEEEEDVPEDAPVSMGSDAASGGASIELVAERSSSKCFYCHQCRIYFGFTPGISDHLARCHEGAATTSCHIYCRFCRLQFHDVGYFNATHCHGGGRSVPRCSMSHSNSGQQVRRSSTGVRQYHCQHCAKVYKTPRALREHVATAHDRGAAPLYACEGCGARVARAAALSKHRKVCVMWRRAGGGRRQPHLDVT